AIDIGLGSREADRRVRGRGECKYAHDIRAILRNGIGDLRVEAVEIVVLFENESIGGNDLHDAVHRRLQCAIGFERSDERLPFLAFTAKQSTSPGLPSFPFTMTDELSSTCGFFTSSFGSFSSTSGSMPTMNGRRLLAPSSL